jgi:hypothetical protein
MLTQTPETKFVAQKLKLLHWFYDGLVKPLMAFCNGIRARVILKNEPVSN